MSMTINVEFLAGTDLEEAVAKAKLMAEQLGVSYICFKFNGTSFSIGSSANITEARRLYDEQPKDGFVVLC